MKQLEHRLKKDSKNIEQKIEKRLNKRLNNILKDCGGKKEGRVG